VLEAARSTIGLGESRPAAGLGMKGSELETVESTVECAARLLQWHVFEFVGSLDSLRRGAAGTGKNHDERISIGV